MDDFDDDEFGMGGGGGVDMHDETTSATSGAGGDTTGDEGEFGSSGLEEEIAQEDAWVVISAFFDEKGLVRQQLDSFDHFLEIGLQECVDDAGDISVTSEVQYGPGSESSQTLKRYKIAFGQVSSFVREGFGGWGYVVRALDTSTHESSWHQPNTHPTNQPNTHPPTGVHVEPQLPRGGPRDAHALARRRAHPEPDLRLQPLHGRVGQVRALFVGVLGWDGWRNARGVGGLGVGLLWVDRSEGLLHACVYIFFI